MEATTTIIEVLGHNDKGNNTNALRKIAPRPAASRLRACSPCIRRRTTPFALPGNITTATHFRVPINPCRGKLFEWSSIWYRP